MYFTQPMSPDERISTPAPSGDEIEIRQGAHSDVTQVWSQKTGIFLGFDIEGSSVVTCPKHPLLLHTLGDDLRSESVLQTINRNEVPSLDAPLPNAVLRSAGTMATGKIIRPKRDRYDDSSWLILPKAQVSASTQAVEDLLAGKLDAARLVATTRMEVRDEIAFSAAESAKDYHSLPPPVSAHLALVAGLTDFQKPSHFLFKTFFGHGGGFFAFKYRGVQHVKGVGDAHTYMLTRALPCGLGDFEAASGGGALPPPQQSQQK
jgi:hypothetical protein